MDTKLEVGCEFNNCTSVTSPGANIASPITSSLFGILGESVIDRYTHFKFYSYKSYIMDLDLSLLHRSVTLAFVVWRVSWHKANDPIALSHESQSVIFTGFSQVKDKARKRFSNNVFAYTYSSSAITVN